MLAREPGNQEKFIQSDHLLYVYGRKFLNEMEHKDIFSRLSKVRRYDERKRFEQLVVGCEDPAVVKLLQDDPEVLLKTNGVLNMIYKLVETSYHLRYRNYTWREMKDFVLKSLDQDICPKTLGE